MDERKTREQDRINKLAKEFYDAKFESNKSKRDIAWAELYRIIVYSKDSITHRTLVNYLKKYKSDETKLSDLFNSLLMDYNPEKNIKFCSYLNIYFNYKLLDEVKKDYIRRKDPKTGETKIIPRIQEQSAEDSDLDIGDTGKFQPSPDEEFEKDRTEKNATKQMAIVLMSMIVQFHVHSKGIRDNKQRLSYFRIFFTENLISLIQETGKTVNFNKTEAYDCSDRSFVRFISYTEYKSIDDLAWLKFKRYSEVLEGFKLEDKEISVPCEGKIIQSYRFKTGLDKRKVSESNISQFREKYRAILQELWNRRKRDNYVETA